MSVAIDLADISQHATGFPLNASEFNSRITEMNVALQNGSKDMFPRQIVTSMTSGEGISAGDFVRVFNNTLMKVDNNTAAGVKNFLGCALETVLVGVSCKVAINQVVGLTGLSAGSPYYIGTSGGLTATKPFTGFAEPVAFASSTTSLIFQTVNQELNILDTANDSNPRVRIGSSTTENFSIQSVYNPGENTIDYVAFESKSASADVDKGQFKFFIDETEICQIHDSGVNMASGMGILIDGNSAIDSSRSGSFTGLEVNNGTTAEVFINASTHSSSTANEARIKFGFGHSGTPDGVGYIRLAEETVNGFGGIMSFEVPYNNGSGGSSTRTAAYIVSNGKFGIGESSPDVQLHVSAASNSYQLKLERTGTSSGSSILGGRNGDFRVYTDAETTELHVLTISTLGSVTFEEYGSGSLQTDSSGNITASSDRRLKTNIKNFDRGLESILGLNPSSYNWNKKSGYDRSSRYTGFIAQNVLDFIPEAVDKGRDKDSMYSLSDRPILATLVNAVKELNKEIELLKV